MVHPLDSISTTTAAMPVVREAERPILPDAGQQVIASAGSQGSGSATSGSSSQAGGQPLSGSLNEINDSLQAWATGMRFDIDPEAQRLVVSIIDSQSGEVLRTVPSDAVIRIAKMIVQLQGQHVNTQA